MLIFRLHSKRSKHRSHYHSSTYGIARKHDQSPGASWRVMTPDGRVGDSGEILEFAPPQRLLLTWRNELFPEVRAEGYSRLAYELEHQGESVKLTLTHEMEKPDSKLIESTSGSWPAGM